MPSILRPEHYDAGAKAIERDPFVGGVIKPPAAIREGLDLTAPKMPKLGTFRASRPGRR